MKKPDQVIVRKLSYEQLEQRFMKIGRDFKDYKKEWVFNVVRNKNIFTISAYSTKKVVYIDSRVKEQSAKNMVITVVEKEDYFLLDKSFNYRFVDNLWIRIIPHLTYLICIVNTVLILISYLYQKKQNVLLDKFEFVLIILSLIQYFSFRKAKEIEMNRHKVIEEILQRLIYD
jgi:uncharacterized DUF497 family protein